METKAVLIIIAVLLWGLVGFGQMDTISAETKKRFENEIQQAKLAQEASEFLWARAERYYFQCIDSLGIEIKIRDRNEMVEVLACDIAMGIAACMEDSLREKGYLLLSELAEKFYRRGTPLFLLTGYQTTPSIEYIEQREKESGLIWVATNFMGCLNPHEASKAISFFNDKTRELVNGGGRKFEKLNEREK
ncbi:MAG: hypothetical protein H6581_02625 [Bacteroidia bacterium]|nr:hypothetical protein [Bacteroidia bacterium]